MRNSCSPASSDNIAALHQHLRLNERERPSVCRAKYDSPICLKQVFLATPLEQSTTSHVLRSRWHLKCREAPNYAELAFASQRQLRYQVGAFTLARPSVGQ